MILADLPVIASYCIGAFLIGYASSWTLYAFRRLLHLVL